MSTTNTIELLEEALAIVANAGIEIRQVYLDGGNGGLCRLGDRHVLFLEVTLAASEQLSLAASSIAELRLDCNISNPVLSRLIISHAMVRNAASR